MSTLLDPSFTELVVRIGWTLVHFLWQGTLIGALYAALNFNLRRATPQVRYLLGLITLLALACMPIITFLWLAPASASVAVPMTESTVKVHFILTDLLAPHPTDWLNALLQWTTYTWLAGVALFTVRMSYAWYATWELRADSQLGQPQSWSRLLTRLCIDFEVDRYITLALSRHVITPAVIGWLRPVILIPPSMLSGLSTNQIEMILLHELAHIRRHDYVINALQMVLETLLFYHPVVHWVSNQIRAEREYCCDDMVVGFCGDKVGYLKALAALETNRASWTAAMAANGGSLLKRVQRIARPEHGGRLPLWSFILSIMVLLGVTYSIHAELAPEPVAQAAMSARGPLPKIMPEADLRPSLTASIENPARIKSLRKQAILPTSIRLPESQLLRVSSVSQLTVQQLKTSNIAPLTLPPAPQQPNLVATFAPTPSYPYEQLRDNTPGSVKVSFHVTNSGYVADISTQMIDGPAAFSDAARQAISRWKFKPLRIRGMSATPHVELTMVFTPNTQGATSICVQTTGSHMCHHYSITFKNAEATLKYGKSLLLSKDDVEGHASVTRIAADGSNCDVSPKHGRWDYRTGCGPSGSSDDWHPPSVWSSEGPRYAPHQSTSSNPVARVSEHPHPG
jgi:bla regulator protein blaR1